MEVDPTEQRTETIGAHNADAAPSTAENGSADTLTVVQDGVGLINVRSPLTKYR